MSLLSSVLFYISAIMVSPTTVNHPLWIVAIYLCVFGAIKDITHRVNPNKNPTIGDKFVFSVLQFLAGMFIFSSVITAGLNPLWLGLSIIFCYYGRNNMSDIAHILRVRKQEKKREQRARANRESMARLAREEDERMGKKR